LNKLTNLQRGQN